MASTLSTTFCPVPVCVSRKHSPVKSLHRREIFDVVCLSKERTPPTAEASPLVKLAWYGSEAFGKVVATFKGNQTEEDLIDDEFGPVISRDVVVTALRKDYDKSYFVTGIVTIIHYL